MQQILTKKFMDARERVYRAIEFEGPDVVPNGCYCLPGALRRNREKILKLFFKYPRDFGDLGYTSEYWRAYDEGIYRDKWGCVWKNVQPGLLGRIIKHPLENVPLEVIENYQTPEPSEVINFDAVEKTIAKIPHDKYLLGDSENFFERLHWIRGFTNTLMDIILGRRELIILLDKIYKYKMKVIMRWVELDIDGVYFLDDWGTQKGLMIKPELWRKYFKPYYKKMFDKVHKKNKHVFFHSDGHIIDIIPDLIEIGVDALNIQVKLIGIDLLSERFGGKICFLADIDRQYLLPYGSPAEIEKHIRYIIKMLGCFDGGLVSWGEISIDVPIKNAETMLKTFKKFGKYPLKID